MPRIYDSRSNPLDFCKRHFPRKESIAFTKYGHLGDGPDNRGNCFGYDAEHPDYEGTGYKCEVCKKKLTGDDDFIDGLVYDL